MWYNNYLLFVHYIYIFENHKLSYFEFIYKKIENFEKSYKTSFLYTFFVEDKVTEIKKFLDINLKNQLLKRIS